MTAGLLTTESEKTVTADRYLRRNAAPEVARKVGRMKPLTITEESDGSLNLKIMTTADGNSLAEWTRRPDGTVHRLRQGKTYNGLMNGSDQALWEEACRKVETMIMAHLATEEAAPHIAPAMGTRRTMDSLASNVQRVARWTVQDACHNDKDEADAHRNAEVDSKVRKIIHKRFGGDTARLARNGPRIPVITVDQHNWLTTNRPEITVLNEENQELTAFVLATQLAMESSPEGPVAEEGLGAKAASLIGIGEHCAPLLEEEAKRGKLYNITRTEAAVAARVIIALGKPGEDILTRNAVWNAGDGQPLPKETDQDRRDARAWMRWRGILQIYSRQRNPDEEKTDQALLKKAARQILRANYLPTPPDATTLTWYSMKEELKR